MSVSLIWLVPLLLAAVPPARLVVSRAFRRANPSLHARVAVALVGYATVLAAAALWNPRILAWLGLSVAVPGSVLLLVRSRRTAGLPPGPGVSAIVNLWLDHYSLLEASRRFGPVFTIGIREPTICVVGLDHGLEMLRQGEGRLRTLRTPLNDSSVEQRSRMEKASLFIRDGFIRYMEPGTHEKYRRIMATVVSRRVIRACEPEWGRVVRDELDAMSLRSRASAAGVRPEPHIERILFACFARCFLGVSEKTPEFERVRHLYEQIDVRPSDASAPTAPRALATLFEFCAALLQDRGRAPEEATVPDSFLEETALRGAANDPTMLGNLIYAMEITRHDVAELLLWVWKMLGDNPACMERLRTRRVRGRRTVDRGLEDRIVLETLRLEQSEFWHRRVTETFSYDGHVIPEGSLLRVCVRESHQDPEIFGDPMKFDPDRFRERVPGRSRYCPFGPPQHACPGDYLTRVVCRRFVRELATGYDWEVASDGPIEYLRGRHWRPSSKFRIRLSPREDPARAAPAPGS